jgi:RHS repeat-associated protein
LKVTANADEEGSPVITDRLGSVRRGGANAYEKATYYPYGEQRTPGMNVSNQTAFGTYQRDVGYGGTLDYAVNRYYAPQWGRFTTPDPYQASAQLANPQSWNRYSYVENDPVNRLDPGGLDGISAEFDNYIFRITATGRYFGGGGGGGGGGWFGPQPAQLMAMPDMEMNSAAAFSPFTLFNMSMTAMMTMAMDGLSGGCRGFLFGDKGLSETAFRTAAAGIRYWDVRDPQIANLRGADVLGRGSGDLPGASANFSRLGDLVTDRGETTATSALVTDAHRNVTPNVVVSTLFWALPHRGQMVPRTSESQFTTLVHEALHVFLNLNDTNLASFFGLGERLSGESASVRTTEFLKKDCKK